MYHIELHYELTKICAKLTEYVLLQKITNSSSLSSYPCPGCCRHLHLFSFMYLHAIFIFIYLSLQPNWLIVGNLPDPLNKFCSLNSWKIKAFLLCRRKTSSCAGVQWQTWNLSKVLHRRIFRLKILHRQFHLILTVLVRKNTKNE